MYVQIIGKQQRNVKCFWGGSQCKKGHTVEEQNYCEHGRADGILQDFCEPFFTNYKIDDQTIGYQKIEGKIPTKEEVREAVKVCNDNGTDPVWTDKVHDGDWSYKFCKSDNAGIIYIKF